MSVQIFVRGKLLGIGDFLAASPATGENADDAFFGRTGWISLVTEVLPRALLSEFGLAQILLGTSGGDQFLVVLPGELQAQAEEFLSVAAADIHALSGNRVRLLWGITENLGDFSDIRKRLNEQLSRRQGTPASGNSFFDSVPEIPAEQLTAADEYFVELASSLRTASSVAWSPETPARVLTAGGKYTWPVDGSADSILYARHVSPDRADPPVWGILRGDVDNFRIRLRKLQTIEEHIQLSLTYKQFFAGELTLRCAMPEFWQKVTILYTGGDDFALLGDWDALLPLARDIQGVFQRFAEGHLKEHAGLEGKTLTMAVALAPSADASIASVYEAAGEALDLAKSSDKDCIFALGRILEWKQLADAAELKDDFTTLITRYGATPEYLNELCGLYRETAGARAGTHRSRASERPWRFHRKISRILPVIRDREGQKIRARVIAGLVGRNPANVKLRPSGRVALEWARLSAAATELPPSQRSRRNRQRKAKNQRQPKPKPAEVVETAAVTESPAVAVAVLEAPLVEPSQPDPAPSIAAPVDLVENSPETEKTE